MGFTKTCFIRINTQVLSEKLDKLGYRMGFIYSKEQIPSYVYKENLDLYKIV